ncbi:laccase [Biomphalaria glabrata]|nr:laccase [Biomphalaria glabrata]
MNINKQGQCLECAQRQNKKNKRVANRTQFYKERLGLQFHKTSASSNRTSEMYPNQARKTRMKDRRIGTSTYSQCLLAVMAVILCIGVVETTCLMTQDFCEYWLEVEYKLTMMDYKKAVYASGGKLYHFDVENPQLVTPIDGSNVITADGWENQRLVITVNKTIPGPSIEVYEGQTIVVHVTNKLLSSGISIHWHGMHQRQTAWSDGVTFITQCPILPGQTFTYRFVADRKGTFWYHAHTGAELSMGLFGPFIVRERRPLQRDEFIMTIQDWNHDMDSELLHYRMLFGNYKNRVKDTATRSLEGGKFSMFRFHSGLINGKGRYFYPNGSCIEAPLTVFTVSQFKSYRFRTIGSASLYPFRVSIDGHLLKIVATDGNDVSPVEVESFIINPGERFDFIVDANQAVNNYWIRAETLEVNVSNHIAFAIFRYANASNNDPQTKRKLCTPTDRCRVANCPFKYYPASADVNCTNFNQFQSAENKSVPGVETETENIEDMFLNFAFPGDKETPGSANGINFVMPHVSALTQWNEIKTLCTAKDCGEDKMCQCTNSIELEHNKVYQLVFVNMGIGKGWNHPMHLHGHSFHVLKIGYPEYNNVTGEYIKDNLDIDCGGNIDREKSFCNYAKWTNRSWGGNNIPGLQLSSPPLKDTVIVPTGG